MAALVLPPEVTRALHEPFTRAHYSAADYVQDAQPYTLPGDEETLAAIAAVREEDREHATLLPQLTL